VYQLCATQHPKRAERALDRAWSNGLLSGRSARACLTELRKSGRNGTVLLEKLLNARPGDYTPPASNLEGRFAEIAAELGYRLRRQVDSGGDRWDGRVDFRDELRPVIVEILSEKYHLALCDKQADAERRARLERAGFVVVEIWDTQVWHRRQELEHLLRQGYRRARRPFS
jgi:very-short-patch-repair endonuclease